MVKILVEGFCTILQVKILPKFLEKTMAFGEGSISGFVFVGNYLCLDFANTRLVEDGRSVDLLGGYSDLARWLLEAGVLGPEESEEAMERWGDGPEGERVFGRALAFREVLFGLIEEILGGEPVRQETLDETNALLRSRPGYAQVARVDEGLEEWFVAERDEANNAIVPLAESAADLLLRAVPSLLKKCENPARVLHFHDTSKNHARRWCSMSGCGNRMKAAAHYRRQRRLEAQS